MVTVTKNGTEAEPRYLIDVDESELQAYYNGMEYALKDLRENKDVIIEAIGEKGYAGCVARATTLREALSNAYLLG